MPLEQEPKSGSWSRRQFLRHGVLITAGGAVITKLGTQNALAEDLDGLPGCSFRIVRARDLLNLEVNFINFRLDEGRKEIVALAGGKSKVVLVFPPQNLGEQIYSEPVYPDDDGVPHVPIPPQPDIPPLVLDNRPNEPQADSYMSGPSWIAFLIGDNEAPFGLDPEEWLRRLENCNLSVPAAMRSEGPYTPAMPRGTETALQIPFRLYISPGPATQFRSSRQAPQAKWQGLWHAKLLSRKPVIPSKPPPGMENAPAELSPPRKVVLQMKAVYSPDYRRRGEPSFDLFYPGTAELSLHALTRHLLVKQMSEGDGKIDVENLVLTALGACASFYYASQKTVEQIIEEQLSGKDSGTNLRLWKHRMVVGRDMFIAEAFFGFLFPHCFPSVYVEVTQRKLIATSRGDKPEECVEDCAPGAFLLKRRFILVQDPSRRYNSSATSVGRPMCFKRVTLASTRSPFLERPELVGNFAAGFGFWPKLASSGEDVNWDMLSEDESAQAQSTSFNALFFSSHIRSGHSYYNSITDPRRSTRFPGCKVAFTPEKAEVRIEKTRPVNAAPVRIGVPDELRVAATIIGQAMQARVDANILITSNDPSEILKGIKQQIEDFVSNMDDDELKRAAHELKRRIAEEVKDVLNQLKDEVNSGTATVDDFKRQILEVTHQLRNAEKLGSSLETRAVNYVSRLIRDEVIASKKVFNDLENDIVTDLATAKATLETKFSNIRNDVDTDAFNRVKQEFDSIHESVTAFPASEQLQQFKDRLKRYSEDYKTAATEAKSLASQYFQPAIESAKVIIPALKGMVPGDPEREIKLFKDYVTGGFERARNGVYAELSQVISAAEQSGKDLENGLAKPLAAVAGLSREAGAVVSDGINKLKDLAKDVSNQFDPRNLPKFDISDAIPDAKLFGGISLRSLLLAVLQGDVPKINLVQLPEKIERTWEMTVKLKDLDLHILKYGVNKDTLRLHILARTTLDIPRPEEIARGARPVGRVEIDGYMGQWDDRAKREIPIGGEDHSFYIRLLELVEARFALLRFTTKYLTTEQPALPVVKPQLTKVEFLGPLKFIKALQEKLGNFGNFKLELTPMFAKVGVGFTIPPISIGAFSLRNITIGASLKLPFQGEVLRLGFNISSFAKPFELIVMGFGGRGYMEMALDAGGNRLLEGALEFGGSLSFDVGVASGGLYLMAGFKFSITNNSTELSGYVRAGGNLNVLNLIHASVEFYLGMKFRSSNGKNELTGFCEITISIDLFFFSMDVSIRMEKQIAGSGDGDAAAARALNVNRLKNAALPLKQDENDEVQLRTGPYIGRNGRFDSAIKANRSEGETCWFEDYWSHLDI